MTFTITARATGTESLSVGGVEFYVRAPGGQHVDSTAGNALQAYGDDHLNYTTLAPGETITGTIVFDLAEPHGELVYSPNLDGLPVGSWTF